jgi:hypothetical protein
MHHNDHVRVIAFEIPDPYPLPLRRQVQQASGWG